MSISRAAGSLATSWARRSRSSVVLPIADTTTTTSLPRGGCARRARRRHGCGRHRRPTCRRTSARAGSRRPSYRGPPGDPAAEFRVGRLPRRAQGHQAGTSAPEPRHARREAMLEAEKRRRRFGPAAPSGCCSSPVALLFVIAADPGDDSDTELASSVSTIMHEPEACDAGEDADRHRGATRARSTPGAQYTAVLHTSWGDIPITLDAQQAPQTVNSFLYLVQRLLQRHDVPPHRDRLRRPGRRPDGTGSGGPGYPCPTSRRPTGTRWARGDGERRSRHDPARSSSSW